MSNFEKISSKSQIFLSDFKDGDGDLAILNHITSCESLDVYATDFENGQEWFNTSTPLSFKTNLAGKIVVLDFFTYCCINCMHVLPDLHHLEQNYPIETGVVVVGVHSAKFDNEKVSSNIKNAIQRYSIIHAVVNDSNAAMWSRMGVQCWPTFVIVSPEGKCLLYLVGEGHRETLMSFVRVAVGYYKEKGMLKTHSLPIQMSDLNQKIQLRFPGKLCIMGNDYAVSDSGNNRILILSKDGFVKKTIGSSEKGFKDASLKDSSFNAPQGICYVNGVLFVADTENHVIRKIDLKNGLVSTVAGTGKQGNDKEGGRLGKEQELSSPWDVVVGPSPGKTERNLNMVLYIAMAGTHQIWSIFLEDGTWLKSGVQKSGTCIRFAGSGNEENRNNSYPHKASFAQPSGLTIAKINEKKYIYVADSESSCIRSVELNNGAVKACVGGERDPMNLFAYGDQDGKGANAKLQHPLAVVWNPKDGFIYAADSYNHKIKQIDPLNCTCRTLAGTGKAGFKDGNLSESQFNEPGGLAITEDGKELIIADTNNHCIRIVDLEKKTVKKLDILFPDVLDAAPLSISNNSSPQSKSNTKKRLAAKNTPMEELLPLTANLDKPIDLKISIQLPDKCHYTEESQSLFMIIQEGKDDDEFTELITGEVDETVCIERSINVQREIRSFVTIKIDVLVFFCSEAGICLMKSFVLKQRLEHDDNIENKNNIIYKHVLSL